LNNSPISLSFSFVENSSLSNAVLSFPNRVMRKRFYGTSDGS
jgi:hypothetical protein